MLHSSHARPPGLPPAPPGAHASLQHRVASWPTCRGCHPGPRRPRPPPALRASLRAPFFATVCSYYPAARPVVARSCAAFARACTMPILLIVQSAARILCHTHTLLHCGRRLLRRCRQRCWPACGCARLRVAALRGRPLWPLGSPIPNDDVCTTTVHVSSVQALSPCQPARRGVPWRWAPRAGPMARPTGHSHIVPVSLFTYARRRARRAPAAHRARRTRKIYH